MSTVCFETFNLWPSFGLLNRTSNVSFPHIAEQSKVADLTWLHTPKSTGFRPRGDLVGDLIVLDDSESSKEAKSSAWWRRLRAILSFVFWYICTFDLMPALAGFLYLMGKTELWLEHFHGGTAWMYWLLQVPANFFVCLFFPVLVHAVTAEWCSQPLLLAEATDYRCCRSQAFGSISLSISWGYAMWWR